MKLKRYVVNLDRSRDRMAWFDRQAVARRFDFVRIPAVDGRALSEAELAFYHRRCPAQRSVSFGELGCFLSHIKVWQRVVDGAEPWAFIAEDDLHLARNAEPFLTRDDWLPVGTDLVKAETMLTTVEMSAAILATPFGHTLRLLRSFHGGSAGYFISRRGAARLVAFAETHCEPVDHFIFGPSGGASHGLIMAQIDPAIGIQDDQLAAGAGLASDLDPERDDFLNNHPLSRKPRGGRKFVRELKRVAGQIAQPFRRLGLSAVRKSIFRRVPVSLESGAIIDRRVRKGRRSSA
jgi:glycosyl transferase family 25